jgi:hypothetical protein
MHMQAGLVEILHIEMWNIQRDFTFRQFLE